MKNNLLLIIIFIIIIPAGLFSADTGQVTDIRHKGLSQTSRFTVDYFLMNSIGSPYSEELWQEEKNALMDLDIFADVELQKNKSAEGTILTYSYRELPPFIVFPAMKRTDQDGLLMGPGITFINLFGTGIHQEFLCRVTVVPEVLRARELLSYTRIPDVYGLMFDTEVTINYFRSYNALKLFDENSFYSQAEFKYRLKKYYRIIGSLTSLNTKHDRDSKIFSADGEAMNMYAGTGEWDYIPGAGIGFAVDTRERIMNPHKGIYNEVKFTQYGDKLGGDGDYSEYTYDFRGYIPIGLHHIIHLNMLGRYRPGTIPAYELYHAGGVNSLRTFEPDPDICGQHELLATAEYRYELFANRQITVFDMNGYYGLQFVCGVDNALEWLPDESFENGRYYNSLYAGVHLLVPVLERVRLEFGINSPDMDEKSVKFGINIGWYEKAYTQRRRAR
ncbi:MAG TPA: BamA/TamA family outer membrane protein [Spirochaetota bacterium]|nr:BamA/TamA family outer membrane protein [Spirochaetota bacterium]HPS87093.1 BamA/TamA family outer membrane protein [Spirochaetota bacterium]